MTDSLEVYRVLVIAPKRVAEITWPDEINKWNHLKNLKYSLVSGTPKERERALEKNAHIYLIGIDNISWLIDYIKDKHHNKWPYDMIVIDESSKVKNPSSVRFKVLKKVIGVVNRLVLLTGTPSPNGLQDLWSQVYLIDEGRRLGKNITAFRYRYMDQNPYIHSWKMKQGVEEEIYDKISDVSFVLKSEGNINLPERIDNVIKLQMPEEFKTIYEKMEKTYLLEVSEEQIVEAPSAAVLVNKLMQLANGFIYTEDHEYVGPYHELKIGALKEILEDNPDKNIMVFYWFKVDEGSLMHRFIEYSPRSLKTMEDVEDWNSGKIRMLLVHPASAGHGLNIQYGGSIAVWYSLTWSLELYEQANARLHRSGQVNTTVINHLVIEGTIDEDIMSRLASKAITQNNLKEAIMERRKLYESRFGQKLQ